MGTSLYLSTDPLADRLLSEDPLALLIGMCLDQQIPLERAFRGPYDLSLRLGAPLDAHRIAAMDPDRLAAIFSERPALHRFPGSMAARVQALCAHLVEHYDGSAQTLFKGAKDGDELFARIIALPGFGDGKTRIFIALLGKQLGIRPKGWMAACAPFGEKGTTMSVADINDARTLQAVREWKGDAKAAAKSPDKAAGPRKGTAKGTRAGAKKAVTKKVSAPAKRTTR